MRVFVSFLLELVVLLLFGGGGGGKGGGLTDGGETLLLDVRGCGGKVVSTGSWLRLCWSWSWWKEGVGSTRSVEYSDLSALCVLEKRALADGHVQHDIRQIGSALFVV